MIAVGDIGLKGSLHGRLKLRAPNLQGKLSGHLSYSSYDPLYLSLAGDAETAHWDAVHPGIEDDDCQFAQTSLKQVSESVYR